jgi:hypothetical protein
MKVDPRAIEVAEFVIERVLEMEMLDLLPVDCRIEKADDFAVTMCYVHLGQRGRQHALSFQYGLFDTVHPWREIVRMALHDEAQKRELLSKQRRIQFNYLPFSILRLEAD